MKRYGTLFFYVIIFYSCNHENTSAINNSIRADTSSKQTTLKNTTSISAESVFNLSDTFQTQNKNNFILSALAGKPTVAGMIFTNCGYACPRLTSDMKNIATKLKEDRKKVNFILVSFDPERDNPDQLQKFAEKMGLDENWILLHGNEQTVRTLSVLLNVQFEKDAEGNFSHSNIISLLDKNGVLTYQKEGLKEDHMETLVKIKELLK
jgi:protein SCO1/2